MKQPEHNEIDSLLRAWAGRRPVVFTGQGSAAAGAHLDADELSSYAEGALPPSARARYTSHLVDCDDCRKIVVQLSLAAGPVSAESKASRETVPSGWRQMLAMLFAPAVLKFAVPALALVVVGVLFVTSRRQSERSSVALNNQLENKTPTAAPPQGNAGSTLNDKFSDQKERESPPKAARAATAADKAGEKDSKTADTAGASASTRAGNETEAGKKKPADEERKEVAAVAQPSYAPEPPPAAAKPASANPPKEPAETANVRAEPRDAAARKRESERAASSSAATAGATTGGQDADRPKAKSMSGARANETRRDDSSETRSVAGRRFQKRDGIWVDSAYNSAMSLTKIPRGSEQYRALVADEPEIGTIAKQLSGEVILIWKGRAYRIN